ncbi:MAG: RsmD family RNA methyltransferase [Firmicutes bacterium]|nr:RsmD family RNA methyltransferase [Bacillota bacterium]
MRILGGKYKYRELFSPKGDSVRPTGARVRQVLFDVLRPQIEDASFLDLFAGSGVVGIEALSMGARVIFCDIDTRYVKKNLQHIGESEGGVFSGSFEEFASGGLANGGLTNSSLANSSLMNGGLDWAGSGFDFIYVDPPFKKPDYYKKVLEVIAKNGLLAKGIQGEQAGGGQVILECDSKLDVTKVLADKFIVVKEKKVGSVRLLFLEYA